MLLDRQLELSACGVHLSRNEPLSFHPLIVPETTVLSEIVGEQATTSCILVTDESETIVGLVLWEEIAKRLGQGHQRERERWATTPLSALVPTRLAPADAPEGLNKETQIDSTAIFSNDQLIGLATAQDTFLSWRYILPALSAAATDPLTALANRTTFERRLCEEWARSSRMNQSIGLILCDIDQFKPYNDTYGHQFGDQVIQQVSEALEGSLRSYDLVARYGGDEFICMTLGCRSTDICIPIKRIQARLQSLVVSKGEDHVRPTVSVGAAVCHDNFHRFSPEQLVEAADQCLYRSKAEGYGFSSYVEHLCPKLRDAEMRCIPPENSPFAKAAECLKELAEQGSLSHD